MFVFVVEMLCGCERDTIWCIL